MTSTDYDSRLKILTTLFTGYHKADDREGMKVYLKMTEDIPVDVLSKTCHKLILEEDFLPSIHKLVSGASKVMSVKDQGNKELADRNKGPVEAWEEVMKGLSEYGIYKVPEWSSETVKEAVKAIGWRNLCYCEESNLSTVRAQFLKVYDGIRSRKKETAMIAYVLGRNPQGLLGVGKVTRQIE